MRPGYPVSLRYAVLFALLAWGCADGRGQPSSFRELAQQFERAHRAHDLAALHALICWNDVDAAARAAFDKQVARDFERDIGSVFAEPLDETGANNPPCAGLQPVGQLRVTFVPPTETTPPAATRYLYGRVGSIYMLAPVAVPVP